MAIINRSRTIRPSSRKATSTSYKIDVEKVSESDTLIVTINHESKSGEKIYRFSGKSLIGKKSIHFKADSDGVISWGKVIPEEI